ncbi:TPA: hypothetical protein ACX6NV_002028 [Photobacterium damselae]
MHIAQLKHRKVQRLGIQNNFNNCVAWVAREFDVFTPYQLALPLEQSLENVNRILEHFERCDRKDADIGFLVMIGRPHLVKIIDSNTVHFVRTDPFDGCAYVHEGVLDSDWFLSRNYEIEFYRRKTEDVRSEYPYTNR